MSIIRSKNLVDIFLILSIEYCFGSRLLITFLLVLRKFSQMNLPCRSYGRNKYQRFFGSPNSIFNYFHRFSFINKRRIIKERKPFLEK
jgi:hypothetical protein